MTFSRFDHQCMATALRLAEKGRYTADPNPRVGCVIADEKRVIATGWHREAGGPHAEIAALDELNGSARALTAYVTLEPCNHHGRTPPCSEALLRAGIGRVVVAMEDPNEASGGGLRRLREAGVRVESGLMRKQAEALNPGFITRMRRGRPWVRVKSAISLDGRTALRSGESKWISGEASRRDVQRWRARSSAILTGIGTVLADNPRMTARVAGDVLQPLRVIADSRWRIPPDSRILADPRHAVVAGDRQLVVPEGLGASGVRCLPLPAPGGRIDLHALFQELAALQLNEVQVEAGPELCGALLNAGLVDEILIYQAATLLGDAAFGPFALGPIESMAERTHLELLESTTLGTDLRLRLRPAGRGETCSPES